MFLFLYSLKPFKKLTQLDTADSSIGTDKGVTSRYYCRAWCFKQIWKVGKVGKVGKEGKEGRLREYSALPTCPRNGLARIKSIMYRAV